MQEWINFDMKVKKNIPEVMEFAIEKLINDKMKSYCNGDEDAIEQFDYWCNQVTIDKARGAIYVDAYLFLYDSLYILLDFLEDIEKNIPNAEFEGTIEKNNSYLGLLERIEFEMKKSYFDYETIEFDENGEIIEDEDYDEEDDGEDEEE